MERYLAFYGSVYYPSSGMGDFIGDYNNAEKAIQATNKAHQKERPNEDYEFAYACVYDTVQHKNIYSK